ncbi:MAG: hypothetical protein J0L81_10605 [Caulobacterales bacterium]|jgi:hypothetical protein|nr:hypothetical protein [Caulobacterales bacterium]
MFKHILAVAGLAAGLLCAGQALAQTDQEYLDDRFTEALLSVRHDSLVSGPVALQNSGAPFIIENPGNAVAFVLACESRCSGVGARLSVAGMPQLRARNMDDDTHKVVLEIPQAYTRSLSNFEISVDLGCRVERGCLHRWGLLTRGSALPLSQRGVRSMPTPAELAQAARATSVQWVQQPNGEDLRFYYPARAWGSNISGSARLDCLIASGGALRCRAANEQPTYQGFGDAALKLATMLRVAERNEAGESLVGQRVSVPIQFQPGA